jgi:hypothetical protein
MRAAVVCLAVALAGCTLRGSRQPAIPPAPTADLAKPAPDPPLSIPQTSASLNTPREWNAAAIPYEESPIPSTSEKVEVAPAARKIRTAGPSTKPPETAGPPDSPDPAATPEAEPAAAAPPESDTAPFQAIMPAEQQTQLKTTLATRKHDILSLLTKAADHGGSDQTLIDRIKSSLKLAEDAAQHGDYTQADDFSKRALLLAQELKVE